MRAERIYTIKLTPEELKTARYCLTEYERMVRQKVMRKIELNEHIPAEVLNLLARLSEVNDQIFEERIRFDHLGEVSNRKHGKSPCF